MKTVIHASLATILLATTLTYSRPSHAIVGAFSGPTVALVGLATIGGGYGIAQMKGGSCGSNVPVCIPITAFLGVLVMGIGLIVLDGEEGQTMSFKAIQAKDAKVLRLTEEELESYHAELDQANAVFAMVSEELSHLEKATEQDSVKAWEKAKDLVSAETFSAMVKISQQSKK